jgi:hypothetical protein
VFNPNPVRPLALLSRRWPISLLLLSGAWVAVPVWGAGEPTPQVPSEVRFSLSDPAPVPADHPTPTADAGLQFKVSADPGVDTVSPVVSRPTTAVQPIREVPVLFVPERQRLWVELTTYGFFVLTCLVGLVSMREGAKRHLGDASGR